MKTNTTTEPTSPLEGLAAEADTLTQPPPLGEGVTDADVAERAKQEQEAEGLKQVEAMAVGVVFMAMKFGRGALAKKLPEVNETIPDNTLGGSAHAALPLMKKHLSKLMESAAKSPELAALLLGLMPIAMGLVEAVSLHEKRAAAVSASEPEKADAGPLPAVDPA